MNLIKAAVALIMSEVKRIKPSVAISSVAAILALLILWEIFGAAIETFSAKDWLAILGTLAASFFGAAFAFGFAKYQSDKEQVKKDVTAGNLVLFILTQMCNETRQYQKEVVSPYRDRQDAWLNLHIGMGLTADLSFQKQDITFILTTKGATFQTLMLEESRFRLLAHLIESHRELVLSQVWPRLEVAGLRIGEQRPEEEIVAILGPGVVQQLKVTTRGIVDFTDENEKSLKDAFQKVRSALRAIYPPEGFIDFKPETNP